MTFSHSLGPSWPLAIRQRMSQMRPWSPLSEIARLLQSGRTIEGRLWRNWGDSGRFECAAQRTASRPWSPLREVALRLQTGRTIEGRHGRIEGEPPQTAAFSPPVEAAELSTCLPRLPPWANRGAYTWRKDPSAPAASWLPCPRRGIRSGSATSRRRRRHA
jgi:hypothetical protein